MEETSADCLHNAVCGFAYVYGFCVRLCTDFSHDVRVLRAYTAFVRIVRLLRTYMAYLLRTFCGFCVHICLIFVVLNADSLEGSNLEGSSISFVCINARNL